MDTQSRRIRETCYGRDDLLDQLRQKYLAAAAGDPQFAILLGSTGMGKTRLAQEIYRWLTHDHDPASEAYPNGYWPDSFIDESAKDSVNPRFDDRPRPEIPFLWWGLRFKDGEEPWEAVQQSLHWLGVHSLQVAQRRNLACHDRAGWYQLFGLGATAAGLVPGVGFAANWVALAKEGYDAWQRNRERAAGHPDDDESLIARSQRINAARLQEIDATLGMFLDRKCSAAPTVPVVLFLDDAHWMDPLSLRLVRQLWTQATESGWKLLVVATHWEDEWKLHLQAEPPPESPQKLAQFVVQVASAETRASAETGAGVEMLAVGGVSNRALRAWITKVLPGLTEDQSQLLLDKARALSTETQSPLTDTGSPRVIEQLLQWLLQTPGRFFVDRDTGKPLLPSAIDEIRHQIHDLNDIVKRRYLGLSADVRQALGWSSVQGVRFLNQISYEIAGKLDFGLGREQFAASIQRAEDPHCWIERIQQRGIDQGRFNLCEFRSNVFREVVRNNLDLPADEVAAIEDAIRETLATWMLAGRFACPPVARDGEVTNLLIGPDDLTVAERRDALRMAIDRFRPVVGPGPSPEPWQRYGEALVQLIELDTSGPLWGEPVYWEQAERTAIQLALARVEGWPIADVGLSRQITVADLLVQMREYELAARILTSLHLQFQPAEAGTDRTARRAFALVLERLADVQFRDGHARDAFELFVQCLQLSRQIVEEFGRSPEALRDLFVSLSRFALLAFDAGEAQVGCERLGECLELVAEIEQRGWATAETVGDRKWVEVQLAKRGCRVEP